MWNWPKHKLFVGGKPTIYDAACCECRATRGLLPLLPGLELPGKRGWVKCSQVLWPTANLDRKPPRVAKRHRRRIRLALFEYHANRSLLLRDVHFVFAR